MLTDLLLLSLTAFWTLAFALGFTLAALQALH
jgi:hypothetical protein